MNAREITALLSERVSDYNKAYDALKSSRDFVEWDVAREDMRQSIGFMSKLIDQLVIQYNAMAKQCGVTSHKDIIEHIELSIMTPSKHQAI